MKPTEHHQSIGGYKAARHRLKDTSLMECREVLAANEIDADKTETPGFEDLVEFGNVVHVAFSCMMKHLWSTGTSKHAVAQDPQQHCHVDRALFVGSLSSTDVRRSVSKSAFWSGNVLTLLEWHTPCPRSNDCRLFRAMFGPGWGLCSAARRTGHHFQGCERSKVAMHIYILLMPAPFDVYSWNFCFCLSGSLARRELQSLGFVQVAGCFEKRLLECQCDHFMQPMWHPSLVC